MRVVYLLSQAGATVSTIGRQAVSDGEHAAADDFMQARIGH